MPISAWRGCYTGARRLGGEAVMDAVLPGFFNGNYILCYPPTYPEDQSPQFYRQMMMY